jgi:hypothetical protein
MEVPGRAHIILYPAVSKPGTNTRIVPYYIFTDLYIHVIVDVLLVYQATPARHLIIHPKP